MSGIPIGELAASAACILSGAFVAGAESAVVSLPAARLRALRDELGESRGHHIARYLADPTPILTRLLAFRVTSLTAASMLAANALVSSRAPFWQLAALTLSVSVAYGAVAEIFMTIGRQRGRTLAARALSVTRPFELLFVPVAAPLVLIGRLIHARVKLHASDEPPVTEREVEYLVEEAENTGGLDKKRGQMLQNVLELNDVTARDVMVPRTRTHAIEMQTPVDRVLALVTEEGHSRVPLYRGQIDNVVGVLHVKDLFRALQKCPPGVRHDEAVSLEEIARKPTLMVPGTQSALAVLRDMQARRTHLAMVVDEFGGVIGMVTLEDILEELVGDIQDEHDADESPIQSQGEGRYLVAAAVAIHELGEQLGVEFPEGAAYASLGGFLAERAGRVPAVGTMVEWGGYTFTVREGDQRRVTKVEIVKSRKSVAPTAMQAAE